MVVSLNKACINFYGSMHNFSQYGSLCKQIGDLESHIFDGGGWKGIVTSCSLNKLTSRTIGFYRIEKTRRTLVLDIEISFNSRNHLLLS